MDGRVYQTHQFAQSAAISAALKASPSVRAVFVRFSGGTVRERAVQPFEGGPAFAVKMLVEGWQIEELDAAELERRVVIGRRRAVDELLERAQASKARAQELLGSKYAEHHHKEARRLVLEAESLLDESQPTTQLDSRVA